MINRYQLFLTGVNVLYQVTDGSGFVQLGLIMLFFLNLFHNYCFDEMNNKQFGFLVFLLSTAIAVVMTAADPATTPYGTSIVYQWVASALFGLEITL